MAAVGSTVNKVLDEAVNAITSFQVGKSGHYFGSSAKTDYVVAVHGSSTDTQGNVDQNQIVSPDDQSTRPPADMIHGAPLKLVSATVPLSSGQPTSKHFFRPRSLDSSIANGFTFGKANKVALNMGRKHGQATTLLIAKNPNIASAHDVDRTTGATSGEESNTYPRPARDDSTAQSTGSANENVTNLRFATPIYLGQSTAIAHDAVASTTMGSMEQYSTTDVSQPRSKLMDEFAHEASSPAKPFSNMVHEATAPASPKPAPPVSPMQNLPSMPQTPDQATCEASPPVKSTEHTLSGDPDRAGDSESTPQPPIPDIVREPVAGMIIPLRKVTEAHNSRPMQRPISQPKPTTPEATRLLVHAKAKVMKPRRKRSRPSASNDPVPLDIHSTHNLPTQEDLMSVLLSRYKHDKQRRDQERVAHATEVQDLKDITDLLWEQLQEERAKGQLLGEEMSTYKAKLPLWDAKVTKFRDFIQGLANDHNGLRDRAKEIQSDQAQLQMAKTQIDADLQNINHSLGDTTSKTKDVLARARVDMQCFLQESQNTDAKLRDSNRMLDKEREKNHLYVAEIRKLTTKHDNIAQLLAAQGNLHTQKLDEIFDSVCRAQDNGKLESLDDIQGTVHQCLDIVKSLPDTGIKAEDLQPLEAAVATSTDRILGTMESCRQDFKVSDLHSQKCLLSLQQGLRVIGASVKNERLLTDQIAESCITKGALETRAVAAEAALEESRSTVAGAEAMKSTLQRRIADLEAEAISLRRDAQESPQNTERLLELDSKNKAIIAQMDGLHDVVVTGTKTLQDKMENYAHLQLRLEDSEAQLRLQYEKVAAQAKEQEAFNRQTLVKYEEDRKRGSQQAKFELNTIDARHRIEIMDLKHKLNLADDQIAKGIEKLNQLRSEKQSSEQSVSRLSDLLAQIQNEKEAVDATAEDRLELIKQAQAEKESAFKLAEDRLSIYQKKEAELATQRSLTTDVEKAKSTLATQLDEQTTRLARLQQSIHLTNATIDGKSKQIRELEDNNTALVDDIRKADDARRIAEARQNDEAKRAAEAIQELKDYKTANIQCSPRRRLRDARGTQENPPMPRRKVHRSGLRHYHLGSQVSQLQTAPQPSPAAPFTPQRLSAFFGYKPEENDEPLDDIASYFPATPDLSSQITRPSVKFVEDSIEMMNLQIGDDDVDLDYITMSQVEGGIPETAPAPLAKPSGIDLQNAGRAQHASTAQVIQPRQICSPPKGILKSNGSLKRSAESAGLNTNTKDTRKRGLKAESQNLGPVIQDSQSQAGSQGQARSRRISRSTITRPKVDKFSQYFSQELTKAP